jgi:hypothetical protein
MASKQGRVTRLAVGRRYGWVMVRGSELTLTFEGGPTGDLFGHGSVGTSTEATLNLQLWNDDGVDVLGATEVVRRNWLIEQLRTAIVNDVEIVITYDDVTNLVDHVILVAGD